LSLHHLHQAEGMGFEPTTPCGASDFESAQNCEIPAENGVSAQLVSILGSSRNVQSSCDADLALIAVCWADLPPTVRAAIVAMVVAVTGR